MSSRDFPFRHTSHQRSTHSEHSFWSWQTKVSPPAPAQRFSWHPFVCAVCHSKSRVLWMEIRRSRMGAFLTSYPLQKFSWAFVFSWESHEILMRKWLSHENFRNLMRIFHEVFRSWEFHFSHEKLFFLMRIEKAHETFPRSREILYPTRGVFEKSSWAFSPAILSASYIFPLPPFSNLIQIIILCSSPQASPSLFPNQ